jgi:hypothetical protein
LLEELTEVQQRKWQDVEAPDPETRRVQVRPKGVKTAEPRGKPVKGLGREYR